MPIRNQSLQISSVFLLACVLCCSVSSVNAEDAFSDVDLLKPFVNRAKSWTSFQLAADSTEGMFGFASRTFAGIEKGRCLRRGAWTESPPDLKTSNWGSHSIHYSVFEFSSETEAAKALEAVFSVEFETAYQKFWDDINGNYMREAQQWASKPDSTSIIRPGLIGNNGWEPGLHTTTGTGQYHYEEFGLDVGSMQAERKSGSLVYEHRTVISGSKEKGGKYISSNRLTGDRWLHWWAKIGFARRGQYVLGAIVDVTTSQKKTPARNGQGPYLINSPPGFPGELWQKVQSMLADAHEGRPLLPPEGDIIEGDGIPLEVKVYAKGYGSESEYFLTDGVPSDITISGTVTDQYGDPVVEATVFLVEKNVEVKTGADGDYVVRASHSGDTPYSTTVDFTLIKELSGLKAKLTGDSNITANGKRTEVTVEVADENGPLKDKEIEISDTIGFKKGGKIVNYVLTRNSNRVRKSTDASGRLKLTLNHPDSAKELPKGIEEDAFPVTGFLKVRVVEANSEATVPYTVASPFPRITGFTTGRFIDAGQWQIQPSVITIEDKDSDSFKVTLKGAGAFKAQGDTASKGTGHPRLLYQEIKGNKFRFHYKPKFQGFDLTNQPEVLKELAETAGTVYLSVLTNVGGEKMLDKAALFYPGQSFTKGLLINDNGIVSTVYISGKINLASKAAKKILSGAGHVSNVANLGFKTYVDHDTILKTVTGQGSTEDVITTTDNAVGLADTVLGLTGKLSPAGTIYWEALKASWELDKAAYKISKQYYDIAEAYQDVTAEEVTVTVEDETGRKASYVGVFKVLVWKGGA